MTRLKGIATLLFFEPAIFSANFLSLNNDPIEGDCDNANMRNIFKKLYFL
jgi:hypothetical protein